ncbi:MAG TPA: hypothetical protein VK671_03675 [Mucilaginibacter sp.]|jgi:hypothetical protein|nr:hypothetical protein [Mucilaginibacter sp.]
MKYIFGIFLLFIAAAGFAQQKEKPLIQFTGIVHNADSVRLVVPYVTITNVSNHNQVYLSNYEGYFSFVAHEQDTLIFTSIGYTAVKVVIPANVASKSYTTQVWIKPQVINLPAFRVFPWATTDEFRKDFLAMKLADDDLEIARKNLERAASRASGNTLPRDGQEISSSWAQNEHNAIMNQHSLQPNPLLNPIAWGALMNQIAAGDKSRASGNGN